MEMKKEIEELLELMKEGIKIMQMNYEDLGEEEILEKCKEIESLLSKLSDSCTKVQSNES